MASILICNGITGKFGYFWIYVLEKEPLLFPQQYFSQNVAYIFKTESFWGAQKNGFLFDTVILKDASFCLFAARIQSLWHLLFPHVF